MDVVEPRRACVTPGPRPPSCPILLFNKRLPSEGGGRQGRKRQRGHSGVLAQVLAVTPGLGFLIRGAGNQIKSHFCQLGFRHGVDHRCPSTPWLLPAGGVKSPLGGQLGRRLKVRDCLLCPHPGRVGLRPWFQFPPAPDSRKRVLTLRELVGIRGSLLLWTRRHVITYPLHGEPFGGGDCAHGLVWPPAPCCTESPRPSTVPAPGSAGRLLACVAATVLGL